MIYNLSLIDRALLFAGDAHGQQMYGAFPYMYHLCQVEDNVIRVLGAGAYKERIVAILHDVIEDTNVTWFDLAEVFGDEVAQAVSDLSKIEGEDYYDYIARCRSNPVALVVKKCDTMANLMQSFTEQRHKGIIKYTTQLQLLEAQ